MIMDLMYNKIDRLVKNRKKFSDEEVTVAPHLKLTVTNSDIKLSILDRVVEKNKQTTLIIDLNITKIQLTFTNNNLILTKPIHL